LKELATATGLRLFYSAPFELFDADGALAGDALAALIAEAETLGAEVLKFSLGHAPADADLTELASRLAGVRVRILIENDQTQQGGRLGPLADFLARARADGLPLGLTFDVGNWRWTGEDALEAARVLGPHVAYVHCKAGVERDGGLVAEPFDPADPAPAQIFARFAPRAIEYPIVGDDLDRATRMHVARLAAL
jgi:sugar phosphate isomerase/epimerase